MCCHVGLFGFAILDSWPAAAAAHWFHCVSACSRFLRSLRARLALTLIRRFPSGPARSVAALWLWSSVYPPFRSRSGLHLRFTSDMQSSIHGRLPTGSAGGRYRCASRGAFLGSARFPQSYPALSQHTRASFQQQSTPMELSRRHPLASPCLLSRVHGTAIRIENP